MGIIHITVLSAIAIAAIVFAIASYCWVRRFADSIAQDDEHATAWQDRAG